MRCTPSPEPRESSEAGSVTAETAVALPALVVVLTGAVALLTALAAQARCVDAAAAAARSAARGDAMSVVAAHARAEASGVDVTVAHAGGEVRAVARLAVPLPGFGSWSVRATETAADEAVATG